MASAVLADRRGPHHLWAENRAALTTPSPNSARHALPRADTSKAPPPPALATPEDGYLTFRSTGLSNCNAIALRQRLSGELGQVRALLSRIVTWQRELDRQQQNQNLPAPAPPAKLREAMRRRCAQILAKLQKDKRSVWFNSPVEVEALGLHDYHAVIKHPMDLGTVRATLAAKKHPSHHAFAADVRLTFSNALRYNPVEHGVHTFAGDLLASFGDMYRAAVAWFEDERKRIAPVKVELPPAQANPRAAKVRMPKAREPNKREMSLEEMNMLKVGLESLPEEKMHNVMQIVQKRSAGNPELLGDAIELDIDEMDIETQWELDRFVTNFNRALNKSRRSAMINGDSAEINHAAGSEAVPAFVDNADVVEGENSEKTTVMAEQVDEYVDIEDEMPTATYKSVEIEKGSEVVSVSGGSGSGSSSSSGSGPGCSGESASEAGNARSLV
ncbi:transcription factor GTE7 [Lolium perenne]|uniref:transcription factor GTE7 n=1 Tax=Lolium perenne TaxID=4522 RepID=UPI0021EB4751|nr:transcription factor GTE4-like isoform X1 [Lolium perenne]XP_051219904.1 transcription factor GTE4-like isoform X1 [Lolium perenne]